MLTPVAGTRAVRGSSASWTSAGRAARGGLLSVVLIAAFLVTGCASAGSSAGGDGDGSASCARRVAFNERVYRDVANVDFTVGDRRGEGRLLSCADTGAHADAGAPAEAADPADAADPAETVTVYEIKGLDSSVAIAVGDSADNAEFFALDNGKKLPDEVQRFIDS